MWAWLKIPRNTYRTYETETETETENQFVDARIVNMLLAGYFAFIGAFALAATVDPILVQLLGTAVSTKGDTDGVSCRGGDEREGGGFSRR